jgi:hypothetical protein
MNVVVDACLQTKPSDGAALVIAAVRGQTKESMSGRWILEMDTIKEPSIRAWVVVPWSSGLWCPAPATTQ